jgi:putative ATPase
MRPRSWRRSGARTTSWARASPSASCSTADGSRAHPLGAPGEREDHAGTPPGGPGRRRLRRLLRRHRGGPPGAGDPGRGPDPPRPRGGTILFCDEIHRFNRAQQDAFLPHVEDGTIVLVGATTENPSFEVNRPLLSRAPVFILEPLPRRAGGAPGRGAGRPEVRGLGREGVTADPEALAFLARPPTETPAGRWVRWRGRPGSRDPGGASRPTAAEALQHRFAIYDKGGEEHYNLISALHKSIRGATRTPRSTGLPGSSGGARTPCTWPGASSAWRWRMWGWPTRRPSPLPSPPGTPSLPGLARGGARPGTGHRLPGHGAQVEPGLPGVEGAAAAGGHRLGPGAPPPPERAHEADEGWGYGAGYRYDPDEPEGVAAQRYLPDALEGAGWYEPGPYGFERRSRSASPGGRSGGPRGPRGRRRQPTGGARGRDADENRISFRPGPGARPPPRSWSLTVGVRPLRALPGGGHRRRPGRRAGPHRGDRRVLLEVDNPNRFGLEVREFRYLLEVADPRGRTGGTPWPWGCPPTRSSSPAARYRRAPAHPLPLQRPRHRPPRLDAGRRDSVPDRGRASGPGAPGSSGICPSAPAGTLVP